MVELTDRDVLLMRHLIAKLGAEQDEQDELAEAPGPFEPLDLMNVVLAAPPDLDQRRLDFDRDALAAQAALLQLPDRVRRLAGLAQLDDGTVEACDRAIALLTRARGYFGLAGNVPFELDRERPPNDEDWDVYVEYVTKVHADLEQLFRLLDAARERLRPYGIDVTTWKARLLGARPEQPQ